MKHSLCAVFVFLALNLYPRDTNCIWVDLLGTPVHCSWL